MSRARVAGVVAPARSPRRRGARRPPRRARDRGHVARAARARRARPPTIPPRSPSCARSTRSTAGRSTSRRAARRARRRRSTRACAQLAERPGRRRPAGATRARTRATVLAEEPLPARTACPGRSGGVLDWLGDRAARLRRRLARRPAARRALGRLDRARRAAGRRGSRGRRAAVPHRAACAPPRPSGARAAARDEDPRALDRRADAAEAAGDLEAALRLRFRAGLLRLDARGAIEFRPSISTYEVRRTLHSDDFDALAATFDDVVYGGRAAARRRTSPPPASAGRRGPLAKAAA